MQNKINSSKKNTPDNNEKIPYMKRAIEHWKFHSYMNRKRQKSVQNAELLTPVAQNWHIFFRRIIEMAENRIKQQKSMSLSLTSELLLSTLSDLLMTPTS